MTKDGELIILHDETDPDLANYTKKLKASNVKINYYYADDPAEVLKLFKYGVDFILTDNLEQMMEAMRSCDF